MHKRDYYEILGLNKTCTAEDLKKAYRKLAMTHHPDKGGDADKFKEIVEAYETLSDNEKRRNYDLYGHQNSNMGESGFNPMEEFLRRARFRSENQSNKGPNMSLIIKLTLEEVYSGTSKKFNFQRNESCKSCNGKGGFNPKQCTTCNGSGLIIEVIRTQYGEIRNAQTCHTCSGTGEIYQTSCNECIGSGVKTIDDSIDLGIPAGVVDGMRMIIQGKGHASKNAVAGDLFITILVLPHQQFVRINDDLKMIINVTYPQLILGDKIEVTTIEGGKIRVSLPELSKVGKILRIQNKGLKSMNSDVRGDMLIEVNLLVPEIISDEEKDLIIELKKINDKVASA